MTTVYFNGPCKWARLSTPDEKYNKYNVSVGLDNKQLLEFQKLKTKNGAKLAEDGLFYVSFNRKSSEGKPDVVDSNGDPVLDLIGNGSKVKVKASHRTWERDGTLMGAVQLEAVQVEELIKYDPEKKKEQVGLPATPVTNPAASSLTPVKPRMPF